MVELKRGDGACVAAVFASPALCFDQQKLSRVSAFLAISDLGLGPALLPARGGVRTTADRVLRRVVGTERRALQAEATGIEMTRLAINDLAQFEWLPARITCPRCLRAKDRLARLSLRVMRIAVEAPLPAMEIHPLAPDLDG
jgi:hypothetical protein